MNPNKDDERMKLFIFHNFQILGLNFRITWISILQILEKVCQMNHSAIFLLLSSIKYVNVNFYLFLTQSPKSNSDARGGNESYLFSISSWNSISDHIFNKLFENIVNSHIFWSFESRPWLNHEKRSNERCFS